MAQTVLEQLIEDLKNEQKAFVTMNVDCKGINIALAKARKLLPVEREQMLYAYTIGQGNSWLGDQEAEQ